MVREGIISSRLEESTTHHSSMKALGVGVGAGSLILPGFGKAAFTFRRWQGGHSSGKFKFTENFIPALCNIWSLNLFSFDEKLWDHFPS